MRLLYAVLVLAFGSVVEAASVQVSALIAGEDAAQTKYNVTVTNTGGAALTGLHARVYVDLSEVFAAGKTATCAERFDPAAFTCALVQYNGNVYYGKLDYGAYSLAAGASVEYKITLRTSDFSAFWNPANDYSRAGLSSTSSVTSLIPVYQGSTRFSGTDPGGAPTATPTPMSPTPTPTPTTASVTPTPTPTPRPLPAGEITPGASGVSASTNDGNLPGNAVDNNLATRWSANGDGQWLRFDLGASYSVAHAKIAFYSGNTRQTRFDLQLSGDGVSWSNVLTNVLSGGSSTLEETFDFADANARYVRYLGHGNTANAWNSLTEVSLYGSACAGCPTPTAAATPTPTPTATPAVRPTPTPRPTATPTPASGGITVHDATELKAALSGARPGTVIDLAAGTYAGRFVGTADGTSSQPIILQGPASAVLDAGGTSGYTLHIQGDYWILRGFSVSRGQKGIMLDGANRCLLDTLTVYGQGQEAVHFRKHSSYNTLQNSRLYNTGRSGAAYGEGVYIGSSKNNWGSLTGGLPDRSDYNRVLNNVIGPGVTAEHVDIKEGTQGCEIRGNTFDAAGLSGENFADSYVDAKGNACVIDGNTGIITGTTALLDGMQTHVLETGWGINNTFSNNDLAVSHSGGYGFKIEIKPDSTGNRVCTNNRAAGAGLGLANVPLESCP